MRVSAFLVAVVMSWGMSACSGEDEADGGVGGVQNCIPDTWSGVCIESEQLGGACDGQVSEGACGATHTADSGFTYTAVARCVHSTYTEVYYLDVTAGTDAEKQSVLDSLQSSCESSSSGTFELIE